MLKIAFHAEGSRLLIVALQVGAVNWGPTTLEC